MIRYTITTHGHLEGARLSRAGHWCNLSFSSVEAAEAAAVDDADGREHRITRKALPALPGLGERGAAFDSAPRNT